MSVHHRTLTHGPPLVARESGWQFVDKMAKAIMFDPWHEGEYIPSCSIIRSTPLDDFPKLDLTYTYIAPSFSFNEALKRINES